MNQSWVWILLSMCRCLRIMDLAARKYRLIERLTSLVSAEKLDRIGEFLNYEIFKEEEPILTKEHKDILDQRLANHKLNPKDGRNWESIKDDLNKNTPLKLPVNLYNIGKII